MDEGRFYKISVEEMGTERRMNGGGSRWLLGCWNEAHPRTLAWTTILQCRAVLAMNQGSAKHNKNTQRLGLAWKKHSPHQARKKRPPQARKKRAPQARKERAPTIGAQRARAPGAQKARAYNRRAKSARLYVGPTTVWYRWF